MRFVFGKRVARVFLGRMLLFYCSFLPYKPKEVRIRCAKGFLGVVKVYFCLSCMVFVW